MAKIYASEDGGEKEVGGKIRTTLPLQKAVDAAQPGTVIVLAADTYRTPVQVRTSGKKGKPITIRSSVELKRTSVTPVPGVPGFFGAYAHGDTYDGPFSNQVLMDGDQLPKTGGRNFNIDRHTFAFFKLINVKWIEFEGMEFKNCWPSAFYLEGSRHIAIRDVAARHGKYFAYAARSKKSETHHVSLDRIRWVQDPNMEMWTGRATWKEVKGQSYVDKMYFGGALLGGNNVAGDIVVRRCHVSHAFNAVRLAVRAKTNKSSYNKNVLITECHFDHIRDNAIEPEDRVENWFVINNSFYHIHAAFSFDTVSGKNLYLLGNHLLNFRRPGQRGDKNVGGKIFKFSKRRKKLANFVVAHNSFMTRTSFAKRGDLAKWQHINNAISILRKGVDAQLDREMFGKKFKWNKDLRLTHEICNLEEFPKILKNRGLNVAGIRAKKVLAKEAETFRDRRPVFKLPIIARVGPVERTAKDGLPEWDGVLKLKSGAGGEGVSKSFTVQLPNQSIRISGKRNMGAPCPPEVQIEIEALFTWAAPPAV